MKANENPGSLLPVPPRSGRVKSGQVRSGQVVFGEVRSFLGGSGRFLGRSRPIPGAPTAPDPGSRGVPRGFRLGLPVARDGGGGPRTAPDLAAPSLPE
jgi:hypothetical protein